MMNVRKPFAGIAIALGTLVGASNAQAQEVKKETPVTCQSAEIKGSVADQFAKAIELGETCAADEFVKTARKYLDAGNEKMAQTLYSQALNFYSIRKQGNWYTPETAPVYKQMGVDYEANKHIPKAIEHYERALSIAGIHTGQSWSPSQTKNPTPEQKTDMVHLLDLYRGQKNYAKAAEWQQAVIEATARTLPDGAFSPELLPEYKKHIALLLKDQTPQENPSAKDGKPDMATRDNNNSEYRNYWGVAHNFLKIMMIHQGQVDPSVLPTDGKPRYIPWELKDLKLSRHGDLVADHTNVAIAQENIADLIGQPANEWNTKEANKIYKNAGMFYEANVDILEAQPNTPTDKLMSAYGDLRRVLEKQNDQEGLLKLIQRILERTSKQTGEGK